MDEIIKADSEETLQKDANGIVICSSDGSLLKGVKLSINHTVEKLREGLKPSVFARCFPTLAERQGIALQEIQRKTLEPLVEALYSDLSDVIIENLAKPLNALNLIKKKKKMQQNTIAWRPSGDPEKDMISHEVKVLQYEKQKLLKVLDNHKNNRLKLFHAVKAGRLMCHENHLQIQLHGKKLLPVVSICKELASEELENEIEKLYKI